MTSVNDEIKSPLKKQSVVKRINNNLI